MTDKKRPAKTAGELSPAEVERRYEPERNRGALLAALVFLYERWEQRKRQHPEVLPLSAPDENGALDEDALAQVRWE